MQRYPARNGAHVACMFHAIIIDLHALHNMYVMMLMYMNTTCTLYEYKHAYNMHVKCDQGIVLLW